MKHIGIKLYILITFLASLQLNAEEYNFTRYSQSEGLSHTIIESIHQDRQGFLWLATWSGISRYDGLSFENYSLPGSESRAGIKFLKVCSDKDNNIWALGSDSSLYRLDHNSGAISAVMKNFRIKDFRITKSGIYAWTTDNMLMEICAEGDNSARMAKDLTPLIEAKSVNDVFEDEGGALWIMTDGGLYSDSGKIRDGEWFSAAESDSGELYFGGSEGTILIANKEGRTFIRRIEALADIKTLFPIPMSEYLIVGSAKDGLYLADKEISASESIQNEMFVDGDIECRRDSKNRVWLFSKMGGVGYLEAARKRIVPFFNPSQQSRWDEENNASAFFIDRQDNLWIAGSWKGLERACEKDNFFKLLAISTEQTNAKSESRSVRALALTPEGGMLVSTRDGNVHLLDKDFKRTQRFNTGHPTYTICVAKDGRYWFGTKGGGIVSYPDNVRYPKQNAYYSNDSNMVYCITEAEDGRLWIGGFDSGISYLEQNSEKARFISKKNLLSIPTDRENQIRHIAFSPDGTLVAGGPLGIFFCENSQDEPQDMVFKRIESLINIDIQHIMFTSKGQTILSSFGSGVMVLDSISTSALYHNLNTSNGLNSNFVLSSIEDDSGIIWIATDRGINRLDPQTENITSYTYKSMGLNLRMNEGSPLRTEDGTLFFNTNSGILHFNPQTKSGSTFRPELFLQSVSVSGRNVDIPANAKLKCFKQDRLVLRFHAIDLKDAERVSYAYKLDKSGDWTQLGSNNVLVLNGLKIGRHTVRIKAMSIDGLDARNELALDIRVRPGWELVMGITALILAAALMLVFRRSRKELQDNSLKGEDKDFKDRLETILKENLDNSELNVDAICSRMGIGRTLIFKKCKAIIGKSPIEYLCELRFEKACSLLRDTKLPISQIAYKTGFNDTHYFSVAFRKRFSMTPSEYRKSSKAAT